MNLKVASLWALGVVCTALILLTTSALFLSFELIHTNCAASTPEAPCWRIALAQSADSLAYVATAVFSGALFAYTVRLSSIATDQTNQLKRTNDTAAAIERAYIFVTVDLEHPWQWVNPEYDPARGETVNRTELSECSLALRFANHGKTHANIERIRGYTVQADTPPQSLDVHADSNRTLPAGLVIAPGSTYPIHMQPRLPTIDADQINAVTTFFYVVGLIDYRDIHGQRQTTGYCWKYVSSMGNSKFVIAESTPLNRHT
jgi:hypothetical protein